MYGMVGFMRSLGAGTLLAMVGPGAGAQEPEAAKTVVVLSFDQLMVMEGVHEVFGGEYDLGRGIAQLVRQRLAESHHVIMVEGDAAGSVAGTILVFGKAEGEGEVAGVGVRGVRVGLGRKKEKAMVMLEARLIDQASGEQIGSVSGHGESDRGSWRLSARAQNVDVTSIDLSGEEFKKTSIGDATHKAVSELSAAIASFVPQLGTITRREPVAPLMPSSGGATMGMMGTGMATGTWMPYQFKGTEHFRYEVTQVEDGDMETGFYELDLQPAGDNRVRMSVDGRLGDEAYSSTVTTGVGSDGMQMGFGQFMTLGPIGFTLFNPMAWIMLSGHELNVGDGWTSSSDGETMSVRVDSVCHHAGVDGVLIVVTENGKVRQQSCVSPGVALPLRVRTDDDYVVIEMTLIQYRP